MKFIDFEKLAALFLKYWDKFLIDGVEYTLALAAITVAFGAVFASVLALMKMSKIPPLRWLSTIYIEIIRGTPMLLQLYFFYFGLPRMGFSITPEVCGMVGLALHGGAYMAESFRAGLENVEPIQRESAISLGLSKLQSMRYVVLPQAVSLSFPSFVANVIFLLKETSVFSAISLMDLMFVTKDLMGLYYKTTECLVMLVAFYLIILVPVSVAGTYIERRLRHGSFGA